MSSYQVLRSVSDALRRDILHTLQREADADLSTHFAGAERISFDNPTECLRQGSKSLSVWLYKVDEDRHTRNAPPRRVRDGEASLPAPLTLTLSFLVTPLLGGELDLLLLGRLLRLFHDDPVLTIQQAEPHVQERLGFRLRPTTVEELTRIWEALREPYRLSVCYEARLTHVDGRPRDGAGRIVSRTAERSA